MYAHEALIVYDCDSYWFSTAFPALTDRILVESCEIHASPYEGERIGLSGIAV
jgi:hypothetical protein